MNKSNNSKIDISSHPIDQQNELNNKSGSNGSKFDPVKILQQISNEKQISVPFLHSQIKQVKLNLNQLILDLGRVKKDVSVRPTLNSLMQNTILMTSMIQSDPNIIKLLRSRQDQIKPQKNQPQNQNQQQKSTQNELKQLSHKLGTKLSNLNDGLSILYSLFKELQKNSQSQISQLRSFLQEKTLSFQDQLNLIKIEQISQRTSLTQKIQTQNQILQEKLRQLQTKHTWDTKELKNKLNQKLQKSLFETAIENNLQQSKKMFRQFCQTSTQLINPQKILQLQNTINENKLKIIKDITDCHLQVNLINEKMANQLVGMDFYKKQRTSVEKRLSNLNFNFSQIYEKVSILIKDSQNHQSRLNKLQQQMAQKTKTIKEMKATLTSLSITEQFQQMLSQIDPEKILSFQNKINSLQIQNKQIHKKFSHINEEIDKIYSKFDISGVMVPNKSRQKENNLNDLREIIDEYFVQNRFANKISKLQSDINEGKSSVQAIKLLQKKVSRLQKQSQYNKIIQQFYLLQERMSKEIKILAQKFQVKQLQVTVQKSYMQGLHSIMAKNKDAVIQQNEEMRKRKLLMSESRSRLTERENSFQRTSSLRKMSLWETGNNFNNNNKQVLSSSRLGKNTISSARKSLLTSNNLIIGK